MATVLVEKKRNPAGAVISYPSIEFQPTFVAENNYKNYRIYPLGFAQKNGFITYSEDEMVSHMLNGVPQ
jgi:hypothetical protein